jgi:hypothetical protein
MPWILSGAKAFNLSFLLLLLVLVLEEVSYREISAWLRSLKPSPSSTAVAQSVSST